MSQTSVTAGGQAIGVAGQIADSGPHDIVSAFNEGTAQMPFGYGVRQGSGERGALLASGFSGVLPVIGVNVYSLDHVPAGAADPNGNYDGDLGASGLLRYAGLQVGRKGRYLVPVEASPTAGQRAWCRGVATGSLTAGSWIGAADGSAPLGASYHIDCSKQAVFRSGAYTAADGTTSVAILEVDFTNSPY